MSSTSACREGVETNVLVATGRACLTALAADLPSWARSIVAEERKKKKYQTVLLRRIQGCILHLSMSVLRFDCQPYKAPIFIVMIGSTYSTLAANPIKNLRSQIFLFLQYTHSLDTIYCRRTRTMYNCTDFPPCSPLQRDSRSRDLRRRCLWDKLRISRMFRSYRQ